MLDPQIHVRVEKHVLWLFLDHVASLLTQSSDCSEDAYAWLNQFCLDVWSHLVFFDFLLHFLGHQGINCLALLTDQFLCFKSLKLLDCLNHETDGQKSPCPTNACAAMDKNRAVRFFSLRNEHFVKQVIQGSELFWVLFDCRVVCPWKHLIVLDDSFREDFTVSLVFFLNSNDSPSDSWRGRRPVVDIFDGDAMQSILINLVPVQAALFDTHQPYDWTQHDNEMNFIVPDHLPEVGKGVAWAVGRFLLLLKLDRTRLYTSWL